MAELAGPTPSSWIKKPIRLDVGGIRYTTSLTTLTTYADSMLAAMFSGRHALEPDDTGHFFIDRPGEPFRPILDYLRTAEIPVCEDERERHLVAREARFYGLLALARALEESKPPPPNPKPHLQVVYLDQPGLLSSHSAKIREANALLEQGYSLVAATGPDQSGRSTLLFASPR